jgi:hypothetical protein
MMGMIGGALFVKSLNAIVLCKHTNISNININCKTVRASVNFTHKAFVVPWRALIGSEVTG